MNNLKQNPELLRIERQIELERKRLMEALLKNDSFIDVSLQLKKLLRLSEQKKSLKPFYLSNSNESSPGAMRNA